MNKILLCTDGSAYSKSVYDHGAWIATRTNAAVHVLHMLDTHRKAVNLSDLSGNIGIDSTEALMEEIVTVEETRNRLAREKGKLILADAVGHLNTAGVQNVTAEQQHGELVEAVSKMEPSFDLLVIGKRGESADFAAQHLGSNIERVIRASTRPVLVASRQFVPIENFLIAYDGGPSAHKAVDFIVADPLLQGVKCHVLRAGKTTSAEESDLHQIVDELRVAGFDATAHVTPAAPDGAITEAVAALNIQLLIMGAYGHSRIRHLFVGSTTTEMVRTCKVPLLMFR